jgi:hypothetical protein
MRHPKTSERKTCPGRGPAKMHYKQSLSQDKPGLTTILPVPMLDLLAYANFPGRTSTQGHQCRTPSDKNPVSEINPQWHLLKHNPMTFVLVGRRRMIGEIFCEVNRRRRSRRGIREKSPQPSDRSRTLDASVFWLKQVPLRSASDS